MAAYWWVMRMMFAGLDWCVDLVDRLMGDRGEWDWDDEDEALYEEERCS